MIDPDEPNRVRPGVSHTVADLPARVIACRLCRFYAPSPAGRTLDGSDGFCRRYPPVPVAMGPDGDGRVGATSWWATVDEGESCGEFLPQPGAEP